MKQKQVVVVVSFLLPLLAFLSNLPLAFSYDAPERVLDVMKNPLETDRQYYILPAIRSPAGGGLKLAKTGRSDCPLTILQDTSPYFSGMSIKFITAGDSPVIGIGTKLDIEFVNKPECAQSRRWALFLTKGIDLPYLGIGGESPAPKGKFHIEKSQGGYKLIFCVTFGSNKCFHVGMSDVQNDEDGRRLVTNAGSPYNIVFEEAFEDDMVIKSVV